MGLGVWRDRVPTVDGFDEDVLEERRRSRDGARYSEWEDPPMSDRELERKDSVGTEAPIPRYGCEWGAVPNSVTSESHELCGSEADSIGRRREEDMVEWEW